MGVGFHVPSSLNLNFPELMIVLLETLPRKNMMSSAFSFVVWVGLMPRNGGFEVPRQKKGAKPMSKVVQSGGKKFQSQGVNWGDSRGLGYKKNKSAKSSTGGTNRNWTHTLAP